MAIMIGYTHEMRFRTITTYIALVLLTFDAAMGQSRKARENSPDMQEIRNYRLTTESVDKYVAATKAVNQMREKDPALKQRMEGNNKEDTQTIDGGVKAIDARYPEVASAIHAAGLSTRDYVVMTMSLFSTVIAVGMKQQGVIKEYPTSISPENAAFVEQNYKKLESTMKSMMGSDNKGQ